MGLATFASFASLVLWCLSIREIVRKFVFWVLLPAGIAIAAFPAFLIATTRQRNASFDAFANATHVGLPATRSWFPALGEGIYLTAGGLILLIIGLILVSRRKISLPLSFRDAAQSTEQGRKEASHCGRNILMFTIVMIVWASAVSWGLVIPTLLGRKPLSWNSRSFAMVQWAPPLVDAIAAACLAFLLLRKERPNALNQMFRRLPIRDYALWVAIPLVVVLLPRFLLGVAFKPYLEPSEWPVLFLPHPLPWVLIAYVIAFFEEFAVRGYLQRTLEKSFSLRRSIFLTGLLWSLPLGFGMSHSLPLGAFGEIPGVSLLLHFASFVTYSVAIGWVYARTRSIVAPTLMHGTIAVFHVGMGNDINLNHPGFYAMELALWVFVGWLLFKKNPFVSTDELPLLDSSAT